MPWRRRASSSSAVVSWRDDLGIDVGLADPAGDELRVLGAEVDDEDRAASCRAGVADVRRSSAAHPHTLGALQGLALGLQGGGHHDLGLLELLDRLVAAGGHGGAQGAEEVHAAVVLVGRAEQDLLQGPPDVVWTRAPRGRVGWKVAMPQWKPRAGASSADDSGEPSMTASAPQAMALAMSPPWLMPPSAMTWHVDAGLVQMAHAGPGHVGDGRGLGDADAEYAPGGAGVARAHADEHADGPGAHEVEAGLVGGAAAHDHGDVELTDEAASG